MSRMTPRRQTDLERRYRALLRALPRWYREQREEEMVATFLAHPRNRGERQFGWPGWPEYWAVLALAMSTRVAGQHGSPRARALGEIVRLAALLGLLALVPRTVANTADLAADPAAALQPQYLFYHLITATHLSTTMALIALLVDRRRLARVWSALAVAASLVAVSLSAQPVYVALFPSVWVAIACLLVGFTREAPAPPPRPWLLAGAGVVLLTGVWAAVRQGIDNGYALPVLGDLGSSSGWAVIVAAAVLPFVHSRLGFDVGEWASALAITAAAMLPDRLSFLEAARQIDMFDGIRGPLVATSIQVALLATVAVVLGSIGVHHYRRVRAPGTRPDSATTA